MLESYRRGYAVMTPELDAYAFKDESLETCKRYCRNGDVIVEKIPYVNGMSITFRKWPNRWGKLFRYDKYSDSLYIWKFQISWHKEYCHRNGEIVYRSEKE